MTRSLVYVEADLADNTTKEVISEALMLSDSDWLRMMLVRRIFHRQNLPLIKIEATEMATLTGRNASKMSASMTEDAHDLLECFDVQLERIVRQLAEDIATHEKSIIILDGIETLDVTKDHVATAGNAIFQALSEMARAGQLPPALADIDLAKKCFEENCR